jgi:hypothetical protein
MQCMPPATALQQMYAMLLSRVASALTSNLHLNVLGLGLAGLAVNEDRHRARL